METQTPLFSVTMLTVLMKELIVRSGQVLVLVSGEVIVAEALSNNMMSQFGPIRNSVLFLCAFVHLPAAHSVSAQSEKFQKVQTIMLSDPRELLTEDLLIAEVKTLDVDSNGRLLAVDLLGEQAFLFSPDGDLVSTLDPSFCHPGFEFRPVNAIFLDDQSIFLVNAGPWGYRFTAGGECLGDVHPDFSLAQLGFLDTDSRGNLVGLYRMPTMSIIRYMTPKGKTVREIELPANKFPNANGRIAMGGIVADETHTFYAGALETNVLKVARNGTIESKFAHRTSWFKDVSRDLPGLQPGDPAALFQAVSSLYATSTLASRILELNDQLIMVQYSGPDGRGYQIFTKDGVLVEEELGIDYRFKHAMDGLLYQVLQPQADDSGLPNPIIEVYQYISSP